MECAGHAHRLLVRAILVKLDRLIKILATPTITSLPLSLPTARNGHMLGDSLWLHSQLQLHAGLHRKRRSPLL